MYLIIYLNGAGCPLIRRTIFGSKLISNIIPFRKLRTKLSPKILLSLCISLLLLLIIFLVGIERTTNQRGCQVVAVLLHYFILTTFLWMGVEAANIYQMFVKVFQMGSQKIFLIRASVIAWGKLLDIHIQKPTKCLRLSLL